MKGICSLSMIPVRKEPGDRFEMVTQILFGETFDVLGTERSWSRIQLHDDGYPGWVDSRQVTEMNEEEFQKLSASPLSVAADLLQLAVSGMEIIPVVAGSSLPFYYGRKFFIGEKEYVFEGNVKTIVGAEPSRIGEQALMYLNAPYLWGGRSPFGLDCSGFTQVVFKQCGIKLLRDAFQQAGQGKKVASIEDGKSGDLAFFRNEEKRIVHVGILLPNRRIIHSSGKVRIDFLDEEGILNHDTGKHTHALADLRRMV